MYLESLSQEKSKYSRFFGCSLIIALDMENWEESEVFSNKNIIYFLSI